CLDVRAVIDRQDRVDRQEVARLQAVGEGQHLALRIAQGDAGAQIAAARLLLPVDDDLRGNAGRLIEHLAHRNAFGEIDIMRDAILFGDDRDRVGVPFGQTVGALDLAALIGQQPRTERMDTTSRPARSIAPTASSSISSPAASTTSPFSGSRTSTAAQRPMMRSANGEMISPPSTTARVSRPRVVPQSTSVMIASCATSTSRRVR